MEMTIKEEDFLPSLDNGTSEDNGKTPIIYAKDICIDVGLHMVRPRPFLTETFLGLTVYKPHKVNPIKAFFWPKSKQIPESYDLIRKVDGWIPYCMNQYQRGGLYNLRSTLGKLSSDLNTSYILAYRLGLLEALSPGRNYERIEKLDAIETKGRKRRKRKWWQIWK